MLKVDNVSVKYNNSTSYKGIPVKTWSNKDLEKRIAEIYADARVTGAVASSNPLKGIANRAKDIATIISSGNVTSQKVRNVEASLNLIA